MIKLWKTIEAHFQHGIKKINKEKVIVTFYWIIQFFFFFFQFLFQIFFSELHIYMAILTLSFTIQNCEGEKVWIVWCQNVLFLKNPVMEMGFLCNLFCKTKIILFSIVYFYHLSLVLANQVHWDCLSIVISISNTLSSINVLNWFS